MYINSICSISPAGTLTSREPLPELVAGTGARMYCAEPDYKELIPPMQLRRMSKPVRTGVAAAKICLEGADDIMAINVGTAYGMLQDSENFLDKMIVQEEQMLNPTAFIQSTHNTVAGQIALSIQCNAHNMTFVHRGHSFESALLDAELLLKDNKGKVLLGAVEECTDTSFEILSQFDIYNDHVTAGEGAHFFLLSSEKQRSSFAAIAGFSMFVANDKEDIRAYMIAFLKAQDAQPSTGDLLISGSNDPGSPDNIYASLQQELFPGAVVIPFKQYTGEYPVASGFAVSLAALKVKEITATAWVVNRFGKYWSVYCIKGVVHEQ